ncbi:hypothetical protein BUALT_Bualt05G0152000 [Buddleja alternifolia]|uniref:Transmembrane protein n=1 Tax=Buddleja alternifolia TaxID=168488 RepID=A0AAV6XVG9_9LAMI|nr:hypothetical protein BUALT_Bualt05G0152000 [Buddleja alternifolia]
MDETGSPQDPPSGHNGYNRLSTFEMENQANTNTIEVSSIMQQYYIHFQQYLASIYHMIDWDCIFRTSFFTIWIVLILVAFFFPVLKKELVDEQLQHEFTLDSLTISEFNASPSQVTGKCDIVLKIANLDDITIYHETSVVSIFLDHELLWVTRTRDFVLGVGNKIAFDVRMNKTTVSIPASFVPTALLESRKTNKVLHFKLKYDGMVREGLDTWHEFKFFCGMSCTGPKSQPDPVNVVHKLGGNGSNPTWNLWSTRGPPPSPSSNSLGCTGNVALQYIQESYL